MDRQLPSSRPTDSGRDLRPPLRLAGSFGSPTAAPAFRPGPADVIDLDRMYEGMCAELDDGLQEMGGEVGGELGGESANGSRTGSPSRSLEGATNGHPTHASDAECGEPVGSSAAALGAHLEGETRRMFDEAIRLLDSLRLDRACVEAKLRETGREDPIRTVTGASALDTAIEETEALVERIARIEIGG